MMKTFIFLIILFVVGIYQFVFPQIKLEVGGGYLIPLTNGPVFENTNKGWEISTLVSYSLEENFDLTGTVFYQSRIFEPNSFSFFYPAVVGYPKSHIQSGDNLKSIGLCAGGRVYSGRTGFLKTFFAMDIGLIHFFDSYYNKLTQYESEGNTYTVISAVKYSDQKTFFDVSAGMGFIYNVTSSFDIILEGRANIIPNEREVYFPVFTKIRFAF